MVIHKIFFDINIVLDIIEKYRANHTTVTKVLKHIISQDIEIAISEDMLSTIYYISKNKNDVLKFFKIIQKRWSIISFGETTIQKSIEFATKNNIDLEDTLQCFCAKNNGCDIFLTSDKKFIDCGIKIVDYDEFLKIKKAKKQNE